MALKELMHADPRDLFCLFLQGKENIDLVLKKRFHAAFILEYRKDLDLRLCFRENAHGLRQEEERRTHHQTDGYAVLVLRAEVLPLLNGAL